MAITILKEGTQTTIKLDRDLTIKAMPSIQIDLLYYIAEYSGESFTIDLSKVEEFDSAGLQILLLLSDAKVHGEISLVLPSEPVQQMLEYTNLTHLCA